MLGCLVFYALVQKNYTSAIDLVPAMGLDALSLFPDIMLIQNMVVCCPGASHVLGCLDIVMIERRFLTNMVVGCLGASYALGCLEIAVIRTRLQLTWCHQYAWMPCH